MSAPTEEPPLNLKFALPPRLPNLNFEVIFYQTLAKLPLKLWKTLLNFDDPIILTEHPKNFNYNLPLNMPLRLVHALDFALFRVKEH